MSGRLLIKHSKPLVSLSDNVRYSDLSRLSPHSRDSRSVGLGKQSLYVGARRRPYLCESHGA